MPRKGSPYGPTHQRARLRQLAQEPWCVYCLVDGINRWATVADHDPPLALHDHREGSGCCRYVSSCVMHSTRQGRDLQGAATERRRAAGESGVEVEVAPEPEGFDVSHPVWAQVSWLDELRKVPENAVWPRLMTFPHPDAVGTFGPEFETWCRDVYALELRWWQRLFAYRLLEHDADRRLLWRVCALSMARQMGKSTLLCAVMLWRMIEGRRMFGEKQLIVHVAKDLATARETQMDARLWAEARDDDFGVRVANGKEEIIHLDTLGRWLIKAEWAVKGLSPTAALVDECWDVQVPVVANHIRPSLISHKEWWLLLTSTAADDEEATTLFPDLRATMAMKLDAPDRELYIEWSAPRGAELEDRAAWRMASPHWDVDREVEIATYVSDAIRLGGKRIDGVRAEWFNIWPLTVAGKLKGELLLPSGAWDAAYEDLDSVGPVVLAVEDFAGSGVAVAYAGEVEDGDRFVVGGYTFERREEAYRWVQARAVERPGSTLLVGATLRDDKDLVDISATVDTRSMGDTRSGLSLLRELVSAGRVVQDGQLGDPALRDQMLKARVTAAAGGGLTLVDAGPLGLVRALSWVVAEAERGALVTPVVYGSM